MNNFLRFIPFEALIYLGLAIDAEARESKMAQNKVFHLLF